MLYFYYYYYYYTTIIITITTAAITIIKLSLLRLLIDSLSLRHDIFVYIYFSQLRAR